MDVEHKVSRLVGVTVDDGHKYKVEKEIKS